MSIKSFQRNRMNASTYTCRHCAHVTRNVGGDEGGVELCLPCFDLSGYENLLSDAPDDLPEFAPHIRELIAKIEKRGKGDAGWRATFADVLTATA